MLHGFAWMVGLAIALTTCVVASGPAARPAADDAPAGAAPAGGQPARGAPRPKAREMKPAPADAADRPAGRAGYLGIVTGPVPAELRAHLDLPEQAGLVVTKVAAGSPAARAGLEANDILLEFAGRDVTSPLELSETIRATKGGTRVRLGIVRRGTRRHVDAVIETRAAVEGEDGRAAAGLPGIIAGLPPQLQPQVLQQQLLQGHVGAALAQAQAGGGPGGTQMQTSTVTINGSMQTTMASDAQGTVEFRAVDGKRTITIRDAAGRQVYAGPLDKEADYKPLPDAWRHKVRDVEARSRGVPAGVIRGPDNPL